MIEGVRARPLPPAYRPPGPHLGHITVPVGLCDGDRSMSPAAPSLHRQGSTRLLFSGLVSYVAAVLLVNNEMLTDGGSAPCDACMTSLSSWYSCFTIMDFHPHKELNIF